MALGLGSIQESHAAVQIARASPHLSGIGFDLAEVGLSCEEYVDKNGLGGRVRFVAGSFLEQPLPQADVILIGHILHDWGMDEKRMLIPKAYDAVPKRGTLIVYESIMAMTVLRTPSAL